MTTLLIDGDTFAYRAALGSEKVVEDFEGNVVQNFADIDEAIQTANAEIANIQRALGVKDYRIALTGPTNFRKVILPTYKSKRGKKPMALPAVRKYLIEKHKAVIKDGLEADDIVGIWATHPNLIPGDKIVVSIDKDLRSIPCRLWDMKADSKVEDLSVSSADYCHFRQTLTGDTTDCYAGCPKVGPKKAAEILMAFVDDKGGFHTVPAWAAVVAAFEKAGLTEADALVQARVARILRHTDYDFKKKEPILWTTPK